MVFVTGFGQMCNNILQFGHVYAWGRENGVQVIGMRFCYKYRFFRICSLRGYNLFTYLFAKYGYKLKLIPKINFDEEAILNPSNMEVLHHSESVVLDGWSFRDYEAFLRKREEIKDLFSFKKAIVKKVEAALPALPTGTLRLGVHIRRADYINWQGGRYFFSDEDYISVIQSFISNIPAKHIQILLVTNDPSLNPAAYRKALGEEVYLMRGNPAEDLYTLSTSQYLIGPPSTFSLMAAFYNDAPLYWIFDKSKEVTVDDFRHFDYLFRHII
ncbi:hypothetical protein AGMMS49574_28140 [Bacteroidia bacterium]|nr:hypothetical protein AGMMS49574_28140 [Bacteroidia bacterium]